MKQYRMLTKAGNLAVHKLVQEATGLLIEGLNRVAEKHGEVYDTVVREAIAEALIEATRPKY